MKSTTAMQPQVVGVIEFIVFIEVIAVIVFIEFIACATVPKSDDKKTACVYR